MYESELERIGNVYMLRDEPPHRLHTMKTESMMATGVVGFRSIESVARILQVRARGTPSRAALPCRSTVFRGSGASVSCVPC